MCNARCATCIYRTYFPFTPGNIACYYAVVKGHSRPCLPGKNCTEYVKGRALEKRVAVAVSRGGLKKCKACGCEFMATANNQRYCTTCYERKRKEYKDAYYSKEKAIRKEKELKVDKVCILCGKTYHSELARVGLCPDCKALPRYDQDRLRRQKNNG